MNIHDYLPKTKETKKFLLITVFYYEDAIATDEEKSLRDNSYSNTLSLSFDSFSQVFFNTQKAFCFSYIIISHPSLSWFIK